MGATARLLILAFYSSTKATNAFTAQQTTSQRLLTSQISLQTRQFPLALQQRKLMRDKLSHKMSNQEPETTDDDPDEESVPASISDLKDTTSPAKKRTGIVNDEERVNRALGLGRGAVLLAIVLLINVWFFSIPTEFRRTRLCNEFDTQAYPELCMTPKMFVNGISDYYKNGEWERVGYFNI